MDQDSKRYVERWLAYCAGIFRALIAVGEIMAGDPDTLEDSKRKGIYMEFKGTGGAVQWRQV